MKVLRTPDERFQDLPGYSFAPNYLQVTDELRMHYVDEGPKDSEEVVLLLHGEPSWSYLYRSMIPVFVKAGYRTIAPDLIGFGRSDKPTEQSDYSYAKHLDWTEEIISQLELKNITLFCQDWGGLIGLRLAIKFKDRFARIVVGNSMLPTGQGKPNDAFLAWQKFSQTSPVFDIGRVLQQATVNKLSDEIVAAYDAPFPDDSYKAGARIFPSLVPTTTDDPQSQNNMLAWQELLKWEKPFLTLFSDSDPIMKGLEVIFQNKVPGCKGQPHEIIKGGGHFLQEDKGEEIAEKVVAFMQ
ncbi:MAG: haloalkane dehalogenase [Bacteroidota bacterium]